MRISSIFLVFVGIGIAGGSAYLARDILISQVQADRNNQIEASTVGVMVASRDISFGQAIEPHLITVIDWPRESVPQGIFTEANRLLPSEGVEPRRAKKAFAQGEIILQSRVSDWGEKVTIVQTLLPNHRATSIKVAEETSVGGFVTPGDYVDVLLTQGRNETLRTVTILQNIRVIGVGQDADERTDTPDIARTVTVEVTPEAGQKLALAQKAGTLSLTLRNTVGALDEPLQTLRLTDLIQEISPVDETKARPTIIVRRGVTIAEEEL